MNARAILARQAGLPHRPHRLQGQLAGLWLNRHGRRSPRLCARAADRAQPLRPSANLAGRSPAAPSPTSAMRPTLSRAMQAAQPEIVFHLAAQPLVRYSYREPVETYAINVMGTVNVLEAVRHAPGVKAVVNVTTDKCYENREWVWPLPRERSHGRVSILIPAARPAPNWSPPPIAIHSWTSVGVHLASARAGNVIGGGDWAADRLIPDFLRAIDAGQTLIDPLAAGHPPLAARAGTAVRLSDAGRRLCTQGPGFARGLELRPGRRGCPAGAVDRRIPVQTDGPAQAWQCDTAAAAARGPLAQTG